MSNDQKWKWEWNTWHIWSYIWVIVWVSQLKLAKSVGLNWRHKNQKIFRDFWNKWNWRIFDEIIWPLYSDITINLRIDSIDKFNVCYSVEVIKCESEVQRLTQLKFGHNHKRRLKRAPKNAVAEVFLTDVDTEVLVEGINNIRTKDLN